MRPEPLYKKLWRRKFHHARIGNRCSVERLDHGILKIARNVSGMSLSQSEHRLHNRQLGCGGIKTSHGQPVVNDHSGANNTRTSVHRSGNKRNLEQGGQLVLVLDGGLRVNDSSLVGESHVGSDEDVIGDGLAKNFDTEDVGDDLLGLALDIRVDEGDVVIADDDVAEC